MSIANDLEKVHEDILAAVEGLTSEQLARENTIGKWSARDVILHMAMWEGEALKALAVWRTGHDYDWSYCKDYLKFNDFWIEATQHLSVDQVMRMFNLIHSALTAEVSAIPEQVWEKRGGTPKWLRELTVEHNNQHIPRLKQFRESLGK